MKLISDDFENNSMIPEECTCEGKNVSPHLKWFDAPENTKSFALIVEDPDAHLITWVHWILYNIPSNINEIKKGSIPQGAEQGKNSFRVKEYRGPCPPFGIHRYFFRLYALDTESIEVRNKRDFYKQVKKHSIEEAVIVGRYRKSANI
ncbi:MAG TPA: YbhB/YbcL family Raf kinase inhibitor-like protein [Thermoplasmatales archaeon]|nr:YbhB/YbcL family Raf kinase inhibitor-like protein [Thermoplasmatales archaeon]